LVHRIYLSDFYVKQKFPWEEFSLFGKETFFFPSLKKRGRGDFLIDSGLFSNKQRCRTGFIDWAKARRGQGG